MTSPIGWILVLVIAGIPILHALRLKRRGRWVAFDPLNTFWAGAAICYVHQPISYGDVYAQWHQDGTLESSLAWVAVGIGAVVIGYESRVGVRLGVRVPEFPKHLNRRYLYVAAAVLVGLGLAGYAYQIATAGSVNDWLAVGRGGTDWQSVSMWVAQLEYLLPGGVALLLFATGFQKGSPILRAGVWALGFATLLWLVYLGTRSRTVAFTLVMLMAHYLPRRKAPPVSMLALLALGLLILVAFQAEYRRNFTNLSFNLDQIDTETARKTTLPTWLGGDRESRSVDVSPFAEFNCVMAAVELVPDRVGYSWGYGHLEVFTRPIPRAWWPDKVYPAAAAYTPLLREGGLSTTLIETSSETLLMGPSFTFAGHWYSVAGGLGVVFGGLLTGVMFRFFRSILDRAPTSEGSILFYSTLVGIGFTEAAAEPLTWLYYTPFTQLPLLAIVWLCRARLASGPGHSKVTA